MAITWKKVITTADDSTYKNTEVLNATVIGKVLTGLSTGSTADVAATDTIVVGMGKLEARVALNDDKVTDAGQTSNATHTGEVTGSGALTIADDVIVNANINSSAAIAYSKLNLTGEIVNADLGTEEVKTTNIDGIGANPTVGYYFKAAASGAMTSAPITDILSSAQASAIGVNSTHAASSHAPSGANANVSGDSGNSAIYDNSGTPTLKSGITQAEMKTAIGGVYTDTVYTHPATTSGGGHLPDGVGPVGSFLKYTSDGVGTWTAPSYIANTDTVNMGDGFVVVGDSNSNATTIIEGETLTIAGGTGVTTDTSADGTLTITNSSPDVNHNTDVNVSVANLKTALAGGFASNAVTIGDSDDVVTIGNDLTVTGDLLVSGDTVTTNVTTIQTEDKSITLADHASPTTTTGTASGIDVMTSGTASDNPYVQWTTGGELSGWIVNDHAGSKAEIAVMNFSATAAPTDGASGTAAQGVGSFYFEKDAGYLYVRVVQYFLPKQQGDTKCELTQT